jgi:hypothetical protein
VTTTNVFSAVVGLILGPFIAQVVFGSHSFASIQFSIYAIVFVLGAGLGALAVVNNKETTGTYFG